MNNPFENDPFVREGEKLLTDKQIKSSMSHINRRLSGGSKRSGLFPITWFAAAATIVLLLCAGNQLLLNRDRLGDTLDGVNQIMDTSPLSATMAASDIPADLQLLRNDASGFYVNGDYQDALAEFENLRVRQPGEPLYTMYLGDVYLKMKDYEQAEHYLRTALNEYEAEKKRNIDQESCTRFYLAITLLLKGESEEAKVLLKKLAKKMGVIGKKSARVLEEL